MEKTIKSSEKEYPIYLRTFNIIEASRFLGAHKETIRRLTVSGLLPGVKIGKKWMYLEQDLVLYIRSQYAEHATSQGAISRSIKEWRSIKETQFGGSASPTMDKEYREALGLQTK